LYTQFFGIFVAATYRKVAGFAKKFCGPTIPDYSRGRKLTSVFRKDPPDWWLRLG